MTALHAVAASRSTHGVHADAPTTCPLCGSGPIRKAITAAAIHYKGSGWAKKERRATAAAATTKTSTETSTDGSGHETGPGHDTNAGEATASTNAKTGDKTPDKVADTSKDGGATAARD